ncbi:hypothetical protein [Streptosporangium sp. NPDC003464]
MHCHAGCAIELIVEAADLRMSDLWDDPVPSKLDRTSQPARQRRRLRPTTPAAATGGVPARTAKPTLGRPTSGWRQVATYTYFDEHGLRVGQVIRKERSYEHGHSKSFSQKHWDPDSSRWVPGAPERKVLYRLPQVLEAIAADRPVFLAEGEKDSESLTAAGVCGTTNASGAGNWHESLTRQLTGAHVVIVADRDAAGYARARRLLAELAPLTASIRVAEPVTGNDVTDHLEAGRSLQELQTLNEDQLRIRLAAARGEALYLAITAENATAIEAAGACALAWRPELAALLTDASVVVVADRDTGGYACARDIMGRLAEVAATIRVVEPTAGITAAAHLAAGALLEEFRPALRLLHGDGEGDDGGPGDGGPGGSTPEQPNQRPTYMVRHGELVRVRHDRVKGTITYDTVLGCTARIIRVEQRGSLVDPDDPPVTSGYLMELEHPKAPGEIRQLRVNRDDFGKGTWLDDLPWPGVTYDSSRGGLARIRDAIRMTSPLAEVQVLHNAPGWIPTPDGDIYVHAGGGIGADGPVNVPTHFPHKLALYRLPEPPSRDGERTALAAAAQHSTGLLELLPPRIGAVLSGIAYRAAITRTAPAVALIGGKGSYKTSMAKVALHHFAPDLPFDASVISLSERGATANAAARTLYLMRDTLTLADDAAPDRSMRAAAERLGGIIRLQYNGETRDRLDREAELRTPTPPRGSLIVTGEVGPSAASATERALTVPFRKGEIATEVREALWEKTSRHGRALVMASFIRWIAGRREQVLELTQQRLLDYARAWREAGYAERTAEALANLAAGWRAMLDHLVDIGVYTSAQADQTWEQAWKGLTAAGDSQSHPDEPVSHGHKILSMIAAVLRGRYGYITSQNGTAPHSDVAPRYGYHVDQDGRLDSQGRAISTMRPGRQLIGCYADTDEGRRLYLEPKLTLAAIRQLAAAMGDAYEETMYSTGEALEETEALKVLIHGNKIRRTHPRTMPGGDRPRVWDLSEAKVFGFGTDDDDEESPGPAPDAGGPPVKLVHDATTTPGERSAQNLPIEPTDVTSPETAAHRTAGPQKEDPDMRSQLLTEAQPCVVCGDPCVVTFDDIVVHVTCELPEATSHTDTPFDHTGEQSPAPQPAPTGQRWRAPAAVADVSGIHLPGGEVIDLPAPLTHLGQLAELAVDLRLGWGGGKTLPEVGQIWMTADLIRQVGLPVDLPERIRDQEKVLAEAANHPFITSSFPVGWRVSRAATEKLVPWIRMWRADGAGALLCLIPLVEAAGMDTLLADDPTPPTLAERLQRYATGLGLPFRVSSAATGEDLIALCDTDRKIVVTEPVEPIPPAKLPGEGDYQGHNSWSRPPRGAEVDMPFLHAYDFNSMFLSAAMHAPLGLDGVDHFVADDKTPLRFDPKRAGYWLIKVPHWDTWTLPTPFVNLARPREDGTAWFTSPTLRVAADLFDLEPDIIEAYVWERKTTYLNKWGTTIDQARLHLLQLRDEGDTDAGPLLEAVKDVYKATIGALGSSQYREGKLFHRPDWRHTIIAQARANLLRKLVKIGEVSGRFPLAVIDTDNVLFASADPDPMTACPAPLETGLRLGQVKHKASARLEDVAELLASRKPFPYNVLTPAADWTPLTTSAPSDLSRGRHASG